MTTKFLLSSDDNTRSGLLKKKIIHYYMANGDATIAEVCKEMNLSIPTVTKLISELQEDGYILDFGKQETSGGRKPSIYGLNPVSGYFVGVDILKDQLNLAILDFKGDKIRIEQNIPYTLENTPAALDHLCECINEFINSLPIPREKILSIGINISGRVNPFAGYSYSIFYFEEKPLFQILEEKLHIKIYIENDTRSMAYGEYLQGVVKGEKNILFINISWGLGIGIIIDGKVYFGKSGFSGEFGHFSFFENEILCHCGKKGCLETGASGSALYRTLLERYKEGSNTFREGDTRLKGTLKAVYKKHEDGTLEYIAPIQYKFQGTTLEGSNERSWYDDYPIYRYADALLLLAEAKALLGEDPSTEINAVRERAYGSEYFNAHKNEVAYPNDKGSFYNDNPFEAGDENVMEAILKERLREFFFEGKRWYDLRRFGKDYVLKYTTAQESRLLWPINEGALTNNPALKQTPGY